MTAQHFEGSVAGVMNDHRSPTTSPFICAIDSDFEELSEALGRNDTCNGGKVAEHYQIYVFSFLNKFYL